MGNFIGVLITERGKSDLQKELDSLKKKFRKARKDRPTRDARSAGSTCGGMPIPGENAREDDLQFQRISKIQQLLSQATIVPRPSNRDEVGIGHEISLTYREGRYRRIRHVHEIVGFEEGTCDTNPPRLSYLSDMAKAFIGQEIGYQHELWIAGKHRIVTLSNIRMPKQS